MGGGILPVTIINNKVHLLFGKENKFEESAPGFADFGGGSEKGETYYKTAIREGSEELTGFLGDEKQISKLLHKYGYKTFDLKTPNNSIYRVFLFPIEYDPNLTKYYNNNQRFIQRKLDDSVIKNTRIFEKSEMKWVGLDSLAKTKKQFRFFYTELLDQFIENKEEINKFIKKALKSALKKNHNKTMKNR